MADLCVHELDRASCSYCSGRDGGESAARARDKDLIARHRAIRADYAGVCGGCGERFPAGAAISKRGGDAEWRAACCLDDNGRPTR